MNVKEIIYKELSYQIIGIAMEIHKELGYGFLEKVYENAFTVLLNDRNVKFEQQKSIEIYFRKVMIGHYIADLVIEEKIIIELKAVSQILDVHKAQLANYLKATGVRLGIIINFGKETLEFERVVL